MSVDVLVVGLFAFADDVEGVADVNVQEFVFGSVVDAVFADKKNVALGIFLIDADIARGHGHAEAGFFVVLKFVEDHDVVFERRSGAVLIVVVEILAVDHEAFSYRYAAALQQADLLGFLVFHGSFAAKTVQMVFAEIFLGELLGAHGFG